MSAAMVVPATAFAGAKRRRRSPPTPEEGWANSATLTSETSPPAATAAAALAHADAHAASRETAHSCVLRVAASNADKARDVSSAAVRSSAASESATAKAASRIIFVALPPFSRDEPATSSGPSTGLTKHTSATACSSLGGTSSGDSLGTSARKPPRSGASRVGLNPSAKRATRGGSFPPSRRAPKRPASARNDDTYGALKPQDTPTTTSDAIFFSFGPFEATAWWKSIAPRSRSSSHDSAL